MSQYPSPYMPPSPPPYGYGYGYYGDPYAEVLAPAQRAGLLMFILGGLLVACGVCGAAMGLLVDWPQMIAEQPAAWSQPGLPSPDLLRPIFAVLGIVSAFVGLLLIGLGVFVRRGALVAVILSIVLTGISLLLVVLALVAGAFTQGPREALLGMCVWIVPVVMLGLLLTWLVQSTRSSSQLKALQAQYQQQYWQYQQQYQAFNQPGQIPPPPPPPPAPPQPPAPPGPTG